MASVAPVPPVEAVARTIYASWWDESDQPPRWEDLPPHDPDRLAAMEEAADVLADLAASRSPRSQVNDESAPTRR